MKIVRGLVVAVAGGEQERADDERDAEAETADRAGLDVALSR